VVVLEIGERKWTRRATVRPAPPQD
jgi:hypothetical protein